MLSIEKRIDLLLEAVEEDNFELNVFDLIRESKLDVVPDDEGMSLFIYFDKGKFTSVDIYGNILNDIKTRKKTDSIDDNDEIEKYCQIMNILDNLATNKKRPSSTDIIKLERLRTSAEFDIEDIADANDCRADSWVQLVTELAKLHDSGGRVKVKEDKNMYDYVLKEKLEFGCWSGVIDHFYNRLTCNVTDRLQIMNAIHDFVWEGNSETKKFICFTTDRLDNVDSLDEVVLTNETLDGNYPLAYLVMYDDYGNPALFSIEIRETKYSWKEYNNEPYYVSPKTGWVYMFYLLKGLNPQAPNTDRMCCVCEFSSERELLEDGCEGYEVEEIIGWLYVTGNNIPKDGFVDLINEYESNK